MSSLSLHDNAWQCVLSFFHWTQHRKVCKKFNDVQRKNEWQVCRALGTFQGETIAILCSSQDTKSLLPSWQFNGYKKSIADALGEVKGPTRLIVLSQNPWPSSSSFDYSRFMPYPLVPNIEIIGCAAKRNRLCKEDISRLIGCCNKLRVFNLSVQMYPGIRVSPQKQIEFYECVLRDNVYADVGVNLLFKDCKFDCPPWTEKSFFTVQDGTVKIELDRCHVVDRYHRPDPYNLLISLTVESNSTQYKKIIIDRVEKKLLPSNIASRILSLVQ